MKKQFKGIINSALTLMVLAACGPQSGLNLPNPVNGNTQQTASNQGSNTTANTITNSTLVDTNSQASANLQNDLTQVHEDEALYQDALTAAAENGFSTQMLNVSAEISAEERLRLERAKQLAAEALSPEARARLQAEAQARLTALRHRVPPEQAQQAKARAQTKKREAAAHLKAQANKMVASGAVQFNSDGTVTLDSALFKSMTQEALKARKAKVKQRLENVKPKLKAVRELTAEKRAKLRRKNNIVRTSEKERIENEDGSITETIKIEFTNERTGALRNIFLSQTSMDGKRQETSFELEASTPGHERTASRFVTHNEDGSKHVIMDSKTSWKNGKIREMHQERLIQADGTASGTGTITVTGPDGQVKTKDITVNISASGEMTSSGSDAGAEVAIEESPEGDATVTVTDADETEAQEVDLEAEAEADDTDEDGEADDADEDGEADDADEDGEADDADEDREADDAEAATEEADSDENEDESNSAA